MLYLLYILFLFYIIIVPVSSQEWNEIDIPEKSPIDLSFLLDPPTGKHGYLGVNNDNFVFEDGMVFRAWGTTLSGQACFPSKEQAPIIADQLASYGFNLVRLKDWDADWITPPLFNEDDAVRSAFNSKMIDRLDYFIFQLANRGIYVYLEGLSSIGSPSSFNRSNNINGLVHFVAHLEAEQSGKIIELWFHRNRYLGRQYRDAPTIVMMNLFHDSSLTASMVENIPFREELILQWEDWLNQSGHEEQEFQSVTPTALEHEFLAYLMDQSYVDTKSHLRRLGIKSAISGNNAIFQGKDLAAIMGMDFVSIFGIWNPIINSQMFSNIPMLSINPLEQHNLFRHFSFSKLEDKPLIISEWGEPWPNQYRAEFPLWVSAMACLQDWDGLISMSFRDDYEKQTHLNYLELYNDPCEIGLFPAAAVMFHQQHLSPISKQITMSMNENDLFASDQWSPYSVHPNRFLENAQFSTKIHLQSSGSTIFEPSMPIEIDDFSQELPQNQNFIHDWENQLITINSDKVQAAIGNLAKVNNQQLPSVDLVSDTTFAVISVNVLDNQAIEKSQKILITCVSEAQNKGFLSTSTNEGYEIVRNGSMPIQLKETPARIFLKLNHQTWTITPISFDGTKQKEIPYQLIDESITFELGNHGAMYYLLEYLEEH